MSTKERLKLIQRLSMLRQEDLAKKLGVSFVTLNSWINGRSIPHFKNQQKIDELYSKYSGVKNIPESVLKAKKEILFNKRRKYRNMASFISKREDIFDQFLLLLTYNTNKIEGSTLTQDETAAILFQNTSFKNKSLLEQLEAKNHQTAFVFLLEWLNSPKSINEDLILKLHAILMNSVRSDAGVYRRHSVRIVGSNIPTANFIKIPKLMKELIKDINKSSGDVVARVADIHARFEQIHPFSDGNGRIGRLLMQAMLIRSNFAPALILQKDKQIYLKYLNRAQDTGDGSLLEDFLCDAILAGFNIF